MICVFDPALPTALTATTLISHRGSEVHVHFATPNNMFDWLSSADVSCHLHGLDEALLLDEESPDVPNLKKT